MSSPSEWPLPEEGVRLLTPGFMLEKLREHPLTRDCYPTAMGFYPSAAGHRMRRHRHDDNLLLYCVEGSGRVRCHGQSCKVGAGDLVLLPREVPHSYAADKRTPWTIYWVHFLGRSAAAFLDYLGYREASPVVHSGVSPGLVAGFNQLAAVRESGYGSAAFINAANLLRQLLTQLALESSQQQASQTSALDLALVQGYMQDNLDRNLELEELAAVAHLSKYHFSSRYKTLTGYSPIKHYLHMKMQRACYLLDNSDMSIKAVAAALGYSDPLYFSRLFKKTLGLSPRAYRSSGRQ